mmetsp:Transcript_65932/g.213347  ORF Transcript_65932/g.213347 Transcript_65932/m.213347 type:complete len:208 (+) Transcript_65932:191-814(+)
MTGMPIWSPPDFPWHNGQLLPDDHLPWPCNLKMVFEVALHGRIEECTVHDEINGRASRTGHSASSTWACAPFTEALAHVLINRKSQRASVIPKCRNNHARSAPPLQAMRRLEAQPDEVSEAAIQNATVRDTSSPPVSSLIGCSQGGGTQAFRHTDASPLPLPMPLPGQLPRFNKGRHFCTIPTSFGDVGTKTRASQLRPVQVSAAIL